MISIEQINGEISILEEAPPTHVIMQKLANLYTVRDHIVIDDKPQVTAQVYHTIPEWGSDSDFAKAIVGRDSAQILTVIDELMTTLMTINPRLYDSVMRGLAL